MSDGLSETPQSTSSIVQHGLDAAKQTLFSAASVPLASAEELLAAVSGPALKAVLEMRIEQIVKYGHTVENDAMLPLLWLPRQAADYARIACDRVGVTGKDRNLNAAIKALVRSAALSLAAIDRIKAAIMEQGEG
jgi:hypothetical protein